MSDTAGGLIVIVGLAILLILVVALIVFMFRVKRKCGKLPVSWIAAILELIDAIVIILALDPGMRESFPMNIAIPVAAGIYMLGIVFTVLKSRKIGLDGKDTVLAVLALPFALLMLLLGIFIIVMRIMSIFGGNDSPKAHPMGWTGDL